MLRVYAVVDQRLPGSRVGDLARRVQVAGPDGLGLAEAFPDTLRGA